MDSKKDYYDKVLGLTLKGSKKERKEAESAEPQNLKAFCFLCDKDDFESNKNLVVKILAAAKQTEEIVVHQDFDTEDYKETFSFFGETGSSENSKKIKFPKFVEIAKSPELKKQLWEELKKRI